MINQRCYDLSNVSYTFSREKIHCLKNIQKPFPLKILWQIKLIEYLLHAPVDMASELLRLDDRPNDRN